MKRFFILASAAIVALASCAKTEVRYDNVEPQEIAFKQIANPHTKANESLEKWKDASLGVYAYVTGGAAYITNAKFTESLTDKIWTGVDATTGNPKPYYWPVQGTLDLYVYAPHGTFTLNNEKKFTYTLTNSDYTETPDNSKYDYNCADLMYGREVYTSGKIGDALDVQLKHALSKVVINAKATTPSVVTIKKLTLKEVQKTETCTVTYAGGNVTANWTSTSSEKLNLVVRNGDLLLTGDLQPVGYDFLVIPATASSLEITYTLENGECDLTASLDLQETWLPGKKYIYDLTFDVQEIKLTPEVVDWEEGTVSTPANGGLSTTTKPEVVNP